MAGVETPYPVAKNNVKVAVVQAAPVILNREETLEKVAKICKENGCNGAKVDLILFPEAFVSWYPRGNTFGIVIGSRTQQGREMFRKYWESSVTVPGPAVTKLSQIAAENKLYLVIGVIEREETNGTLYCAILYFSDTGAFLGKHRKLMPTAGERFVWGFGDGSTLPVFDTPLGRIGGLICWENYMPMARMAMYAKGVQIYLAPTADQRDVWLSSMRHIAVEGRCFVLTCNQFVTRKDYKGDSAEYGQDLPSDPNHILSSGGSAIINPYGDVIAGPNFKEEIVLHAEIDLNDVIRSKIDFDPVGHYSRPDVFSLVVNQKENPPVSFINGPKEDEVDEKEFKKLQVSDA